MERTVRHDAQVVLARLPQVVEKRLEWSNFISCSAVVFAIIFADNLGPRNWKTKFMTLS